MKRASTVAMMLAVLVVAGCGDGDGDGNGAEQVTFRGNITSVALSGASPRRSTWLASLPLVRWLLPGAVAQSGCDPDAASLLACAVTGTGDDCESPLVACRRVDAESCGFSVGVRVLCADFAGVFFVDDANDDGRFDVAERDAALVFECSSEDDHECQPHCNGDLIDVQDVTIRFYATPIEGSNGRADADDIRKVRDVCPPVTRTPSPSPTVTPTPTNTPLL